MIRGIAFSFAFAVATLVSPAPSVAIEAGDAVPAVKFALQNGEKKSLDNYLGKVVVLEWFNPDCPFVKKQYGGNMQALQKEYTGKGAVWLTVNSTAADHPNYVAPDRVGDLMKELGMHPTAYVNDASGELGKAFGARTTPHMFVIDAKGKIVYAGAIDDQPTVTGDPKTAKNYVRDAVTEALEGKPVSVAHTSPYGCSVKFAS